MSVTSSIPVARLFAQLLLRELDAEWLQDLSRPEVAAALRDVGIDVPDAAQLDELSAQYCEVFLYPPAGAPPIESLWTGGEYEGDASRTIRELAASAGCEFERDAARGAPVDHLGCILLLWSETVERVPEVAAQIEQHHLAWVDRALAHATRAPGFYGQLARALLEFVGGIRTES